MFTKFHKDWIKIVNLLLIANFWKCAGFFAPDFTKNLKPLPTDSFWGGLPTSLAKTLPNPVDCV